MTSVFQLLVAAIVAVAFIWFFLTYLSPLFSVQTDTIEQIQQGLKTAKSDSGKTIFAGSLLFTGNDILQKESFTESGTDTVLQCNNPSYCCDKESNCNGKANWTEQQIIFSQKQAIPVFARCKFEFEFFACTIFVGQKPPQLELLNPVYNPVLDLGAKSQFLLSIEAKNTGSSESYPGKAIISLAKKSLENIQEPSLIINQQEIVSLSSGETTVLSVNFPISGSGEYEIKINAKAENAGFDEQIIYFRAINEPTPCRALTQQSTEKTFNETTQLCHEKFFCADCQFGVHCKQKWEEAFPEKSFELGDYSFAQATTVSTAEECQ